MYTSFPSTHTKAVMCTRKWTKYSYWQNMKLSHYGQKMIKKNENFNQKMKKKKQGAIKK